jgi:hypothetical protein
MAQGEGQSCPYLRFVTTLPLEAHQSGSFSDEQAKSLFCEVMCYFPYMLVRTRSLYIITQLVFTMPQPVSDLSSRYISHPSFANLPWQSVSVVA